jgi:rhodanese-related sulfurtransferase
MMPIRGVLAIVAATAGLAAAATGPGSSEQATRLAAEISAGSDHISAPELADRIMKRDPTLQLFDLRSASEYEQLHIASAQHASIETLTRERPKADATIVLYSEGGAHAAQAWVLLRLRGYRHIYVLREGLYEWIARVLEPKLAVVATPKEQVEFERAAEQSRYFGGLPLAGVARSEVPVGYWTGEQTVPADVTRQAVAGIRRRGC